MTVRTGVSLLPVGGGSNSLDVILIGKDDDSSGVAGLHQTLDDLVKLSGHRFTGDLH